jgi:hypothetical protein
MVPPDTASELVEVIRAMVPIVSGTSNLGAPLAMDFSMADGPLASHIENYVHAWLQDTVEAHKLLLTRWFTLLCRTSEGHKLRFA